MQRGAFELDAVKGLFLITYRDILHLGRASFVALDLLLMPISKDIRLISVQREECCNA